MKRKTVNNKNYNHPLNVIEKELDYKMGLDNFVFKKDYIYIFFIKNSKVLVNSERLFLWYVIFH